MCEIVFGYISGISHVTEIASIEDPEVIKQILAHLQRKAESKEYNLLPESRAPPQKSLFG